MQQLHFVAIKPGNIGILLLPLLIHNFLLKKIHEPSRQRHDIFCPFLDVFELLNLLFDKTFDFEFSFESSLCGILHFFFLKKNTHSTFIKKVLNQS